MRVWIFKASEPTLWDHQQRGTRKGRYCMLAEALVAAGHEVVWWTDDFDHSNKVHRFGKDHEEEFSPGCRIRWIHTPGYAKNVSPRRFRDHAILARRIAQRADRFPKPDLILSGMPTDHFCVLAVKLGQHYGVPSVLDVRDFWPDVFYMRLPKLLHPILRLRTWPMARRIRWAFTHATAVVGNTPGFVKWGLSKGRRVKTELDRDFPIGSTAHPPEEKLLVDARNFWKQHNVRADDGVSRICFFGVIGPMYDFDPVLQAARILQNDAKPVEFFLCGKGQLLEQLRRQASDMPNVKFTGWINTSQIWTLMEASSLGLACYTNEPNFQLNMTNKPGEYLSASLPILFSVEGFAGELFENHNCGAIYRSTDELVAAIRRYRDNPAYLQEQRANAATLFAEYLNADVVYANYTRHLETIAASFKML